MFRDFYLSVSFNMKYEKYALPAEGREGIMFFNQFFI